MAMDPFLHIKMMENMIRAQQASAMGAGSTTQSTESSFKVDLVRIKRQMLENAK